MQTAPEVQQLEPQIWAVGQQASFRQPCPEGQQAEPHAWPAPQQAPPRHVCPDSQQIEPHWGASEQLAPVDPPLPLAVPPVLVPQARAKQRHPVPSNRAM